MEQNNRWNLAAMDGIYLSIITVVYLLIVSIFPMTNFFISSMLMTLKISGCLFLLYRFMKRYSDRFDSITWGQSFQYGFFVCMCSSLLCAAFSYVNVEYLFPEQVEQSLSIARELVSSQKLGTAALNEEMFDMMARNYGKLTLFSNLMYFTLFGALASAITAVYTKKDNPFPTHDGEEDNMNQSR